MGERCLAVGGDAGERCLAEDSSDCWGGITGACPKANVAGPENGSRMERNRLIAPLPSRGTWGVGLRPGAGTRSSTLPLPPLLRCPPLLLHQCRKCSTDLHIFPNIRDLFFFFSLCGRRQARIQEKEAGERGAREKQGGFYQGSRKRQAEEGRGAGTVPGCRGCCLLPFGAPRQSRVKTGDREPRRGPETWPVSPSPGRRRSQRGGRAWVEAPERGKVPLHAPTRSPLP